MMRLYRNVCKHYFVKKDGVWTCTMCGTTR
jgi:hypothetical protein